MSSGSAPEPGRSIFVSAQDALRLHVREYGAQSAPRLPVVCLPGLTRTVADFETLAPMLASGDGLSSAGDAPHRKSMPQSASRRVIAIDSRGRGQSEYDRNPANYNLAVELSDIVTVLVSLAVGPAVFVGSSRGGILTMLLAATHLTAIAGVILHDIGPVVEPEGIARIKDYVGKLPTPRSWKEGSEILRHLFAAQFPNLTSAQWLAAARRTWRTQNGQFQLTYDPKLASALADFDMDRPMPPLWNEFDALSHVPVLVIRGANSDILSAETVTAMCARHPNIETIEVPAQGHVPPLEGEDLMRRIAEFVAKCDVAAGRSDSSGTQANYRRD
jgi:pimeloyl-ACP methyl ester carboxylesterase